ncbi:MAG TPA: tRNA lysidine(34) synthetase TilS [Vicinamibacterales bacterium]|nr:tRNA lysidine(34) synthetase TilS [Vicinamibacterales bacterium]
MASLLARVIGTIREHDLAPRGAAVLAALSGGSDSVALVSLLREAEDAGELRLVGLAHFHHGLRPGEADADEQFCVALAGRIGVPIDVGRGDVAALARARRLSIEDAARVARYAFLEEARQRAGAAVVAVGHTRDDQAETFLLRVVRGAGTRGLAAIRPRAGCVIRPLLDCGRDELRRHLADRGLSFRDDATNADRRIPRNRVRHETLPALRRHFNPEVTAVLAREATLARDDAALLEQLAGEAYGALVTEGDGELRLHADRLRRTPRALARRVAQQALAATAGGRFVGFHHVEVLLALCGPDARGGVDLPGQRAERNGGEVVLVSRAGGVAPPATAAFQYPLAVPGTVEVPEAGCRISAVLPGPGGDPAADPGAWTGRGPWALVAAGRVRPGLGVRSRRPGDRFQPAGFGGHRKLQDFFVDHKIARPDRDRVPLVVDAEDRIVWVAGHRLADEFRVTDRAAGMVILKLEARGGTA